MAFQAGIFRRLAAFFFLLLPFLECLGQSPIPPGDHFPVMEVEQPMPATEQVTSVEVARINLFGNNTTRKSVIIRELEFAEGDTLAAVQLGLRLEQSRQNLLNTGLFNFVEIAVQKDTAGIAAHAVINISMVERWYVWLSPRIDVADRTIAEWLRDPTISSVNFGMLLSWRNFRGRREQLYAEAQSGFSDRLWFRYERPFINNAKTLGAMFETSIEQRRETFYSIEGNRPMRLKLPEKSASSHFSAALGLFYRRAIHNTFGLVVGFDRFSMADTLLVLNRNLNSTGRSLFSNVSFEGSFTHDRRDFKAYPLKGRFIQLRVRHQQLDIWEPQGSNITSLNMAWREYTNLAPRWYMAVGLHTGFSFNNNSGLTNQMGIRNAIRPVRGYENFTVFGQHYFTMRSNVKFALIPYRRGRIPLLPGERFSLFHYSLYFNLFADAGYVSDQVFGSLNPLNNALMASMGAGIDFVTYYDIVVRAELSITRTHPALQVHFTAPI